MGTSRPPLAPSQVIRMSSPLKPPDGNWWDQPVDRRETMWLGLASVWSLVMFGWMSAYTRIGDQNPIGETFDVPPDEFMQTVAAYREEAESTDQGLIPPGDDVYIGAARFHWDGLPVVLEAGREYNIHLGAYDVQHGFSIRPAGTLSQQINLQIIPGHEWVVPMTFEEPDTYHVICNEFCGEGHRTMHGTLVVE